MDGWMVWQSDYSVSSISISQRYRQIERLRDRESLTITDKLKRFKMTPFLKRVKSFPSEFQKGAICNEHMKIGCFFFS